MGPSFFPGRLLSTMTLIWSLIIGGVAGWLAGRIMKSNRKGVFMYIALGLVGGVVGGFAFSFIGLSAENMIGRLIMATVGAVILIALVRALK